MDNLKVIENELVPVYETDKGIKIVNGRELHEVLQSKQDFSTWVKKRLAECDAVEDEDFERFHKKMEANNATMIEYLIKLDTAKEMAMLERNDRGKQVRRYFIKIEKKYKEIVEKKPMSTAEQIRILAQGNIELEQKIDSVDRDLQEFKREMPLLAIECQQITDAKNKKVVPLLGGKDSNAYKNASLRGKVYRDLEGQLRREFGVSSYKAIHRNQTEKALEIIADYDLPLCLREQIEDENAQITM